MKILIATDAFPPRCGGSGWSTFYLARALAARGHTVEVVQPKQGARGIRERVYENQHVVEFGFSASNVPALRAWQRNLAMNRVAHYLAKRAADFDVIHAQHMLTISAAVKARARAEIPVVATVRDYWPVCLYGTLWRDNQPCPVCVGHDLTRCLAQKYGRLARVGAPFIPLIEAELERRRATLTQADAVIGVSKFVAGTLDGIVDSARLFVVPNLVEIDATRERALPEPATRVPEQFLLFVGKLTKEKGADLLPNILEEARTEFPLVVVGEGPLAPRLARVKQIELVGWVSNDEVLRLLARATALLFPALWSEPLARVLIEAQALGTPTVAFNTGGTGDIIAASANGLLAANVEEFSAQLARVIADAHLREELRWHAQRVASDKFSAEVVAAQVEAVYGSVYTSKQGNK
jgi:glycosyltransferase involved in cell wall biosynthesis